MDTSFCYLLQKQLHNIIDNILKECKILTGILAYYGNLLLFIREIIAIYDE